ncbi:hypothetical protein SAMD00019534_020410 [Acytostelium subglobosum LB1]|uniref:hypothetical protein n=1 Tax=Acytostelium subglobosum LB1 TaxID=1410327 RepID=UPI000644A3C5|nr:hypothetical protein SAMD00019534_020410 [Acytostelium subglobosum LB1]GAM18866.1 hypothetical protein SAMD00019534_020410 [Acytostelium subglobosum LB1]|eukprot:XP_012758086.1 hypothetical protein SAMD00019534_020410 [Acytostelium subglobosum LB1]
MEILYTHSHNDLSRYLQYLNRLLPSSTSTSSVDEWSESISSVVNDIIDNDNIHTTSPKSFSPNDLDSLSTEDDDDEDNNNNKNVLQSINNRLHDVTPITDSKVSITKIHNVITILEVLKSISTLLNKHNDTLLLSINNQKLIKLAMDVVIGWGVLPCLQRGVGLPPVNRLALPKDSCKMDQSEMMLYSWERNGQTFIGTYLFAITKDMLGLRATNLDFNAIIISRYLPDVFSALLQLINVSRQYSSLTTDDKQYCAQQIDVLLFGVHPELIFESLTMLLQAAGSAVDESGAHVAAPAWLPKCLSLMLSKCLTRPHSIATLFNTVLQPQPGKDLNNSMRSVVRLITSTPSSNQTSSNVDDYYSKICPQLIAILHRRNDPKSGIAHEKVIETIVLIVDTMLRTHSNETFKHLIDPIIQPLIQFKVFSKRTPSSSSSGTSIDEGIMIKEVDLFHCIEDLHKLLSRLSTNQSLLAYLTLTIPTLFQLHCFLSKSISSLKTSCSEILSTYFKFYNNSIIQLKNLIIPPSDADETSKTTSDTSSTTSTSSSQSESKSDKSLLELEDIMLDANDEDEELECLSFAMGGNGGVVAKYIPYFERDFQREAECLVQMLQLMKNDKLAGDLFIDLLNEFAMVEQGVKKSSSKRYFVLMQFIVIISEQLGAAAIKNVVQVCTLVRVLLQRSLEKMAKQKETEDDVETITIALGILSTLLMGDIKVKKEEELLVFDMLSMMEKLIMHPNEVVSAMATQITTIITTKQPTWLEQEPSDHNSSSVELDDAATLKEILEDLSHPLLPVRAHGLIELRRPNSMMKTPLGDIFGAKIIPILTAQFNDVKFKEDRRMKIGESLVQISQRCGDALPQYSSKLFHSFFLGCRDNSVGVRASSLSNLATLCELLKFSIDQYMVELFGCLEGILRSEKEVEVRRGAIFVFQLLLKGIGMEAFSLIPDQLKNIYQILKFIESTDKDIVCKHHAVMALQELDSITRQFIFPT